MQDANVNSKHKWAHDDDYDDEYKIHHRIGRLQDSVCCTTFSSSATSSMLYTPHLLHMATADSRA